MVMKIINFTIALIFMFGVAASLEPVVASDHTGSSKRCITHPAINTEVGKTSSSPLPLVSKSELRLGHSIATA